MNILITAPSLNPALNVSGISTVVQTIIFHNNQHHYFHYQLGRPDRPIGKLIWLVQMIKQLILFPFALKKNKIDLVHQNLPFDPKGVTREFIINFWCRLMRIPVVLHVHGGVFLMNGTNNGFFKRLSLSLFKHSNQVIVLSELEKEAINEHYHFPSAKVLYNSINVESYIIDEKQLTGNKPTLLFLGRIHESKGVDDIIAAFHLLKSKADFRFVLCGIGPAKDRLVTSCEQLLGSDFEYNGIVSGDSKINLIKHADFFLLPSRYGEGLPMALLETMAAGVVPIVTDDASMKYVVQHEINGIRVNKKDPEDISRKLISIISNPMMYGAMSKNASQLIAEKFDIKEYVIQLNKIYNLALNKQ
ncbi:MAG: glycosyltransferase family 4 protein [Prolixibacteraceae bacterium]